MISGFADRLHNRSWGRNLIDSLGIYGKELKTLFHKAGCGFRMEKLVSVLLLSCVGIRAWNTNRLFFSSWATMVSGCIFFFSPNIILRLC